MPREYADKVLAKWAKQTPKRVGKLLKFLGTEGVINDSDGFTSDELPKLEKFIFEHCFTEFNPRVRKHHLDPFSFEICKDTAALIGTMCQVTNPEQKWSMYFDENDPYRHNNIGMVSTIDGDFIPILQAIIEFAEEAIAKRQSFLGKFKKQRNGFLTRLVALTSGPAA